MAEADDKDSRTEEPTEKRISDAIEKGNVPYAKDAVLFGSLAGILSAALLFGTWSITSLASSLQLLLDAAGTLRLEDREGAASLLASLVIQVAMTVLPPMALVAAGSILASLAQNVPSAAIDRITPILSRIAPGAGWTRLFGKGGWTEFAKSVVKLLCVCSIVFVMIWSRMGEFARTMFGEPASLPGVIMDHVLRLVTALGIAALLLAIADLTLSRLAWRRNLRMTRHEIGQELKQAEGDPLIRARIRNIARQRSSRRMLEKLPGASMVVVNPTHYAVALRYVREEGGAPVVVAKGVDFLAMKIREIATEHDVPLIENKPLARSLYDQVDLDAQIPAEFYRAVAEIIHFLSARQKLPYRHR